MIGVRITDLCVRHAGGTDALADISLDIPAAQSCGIRGASAAGKPTLLGTTAGMAPPSAGRILYGGAPANAAPRRRIGVIPQDFALCGRASVADNVMAVADIATWRAFTGRYPKSQRDRAARLLAVLGLEETHLARRADSLSGGQQQRVAIARAHLPPPATILAHEPTASLAPVTGEATLDRLRSEARDLGATLVCSLHQPDLARRFADRIILLDAGRVIFDGTPAIYDGDIARPRLVAARS